MVDTGLTKCYYLGDEVSVYDSLMQISGVPSNRDAFLMPFSYGKPCGFLLFPQGLPICFEVITCRSSTAITAAPIT